MRLLRRLRSLFRKEKLDAEMCEEMRLHVEMQAERNRAAGLSPDEARYAALRQFGNVASIQERAREGRGWPWLEQLGQDVRYAARSLRKSPGFTAIAVLSLALGIGANTAIYSLVDDVLLRSLPVKDPDSLVLFRWLSSSAPYEGIAGYPIEDTETGLTMDTALPLPIFERLRNEATTMSDVFAFAPLAVLVIRSDAQAEHGRGQLVTGNYFHALGVQASRGRLLDPQDDLPGAAPVGVISHRFWRQSLGADEHIVGKVIKVNRLPVTVVGVASRDFIGALQAGQAPDVTLPLSCEPLLQEGRSFTDRPHIWWLHIMARLRPGVGREQARAQLEPVYLRAIDEARKLLPQEGHEFRDGLRLEAGAQGLTDIGRTYRQPLGMLMAMVVLVLVLACFNVANLLLARSAVRCREIAVRLSLGATRGRIVRQLLTESCLLAGSGGLLGLVAAWWYRNGLLQLWPVGDSGALVIDHRVAVFTFSVSFVTGMIFGLVPAWQATRTDLNSGLKASSRGRLRGPMRYVLTLAQIALSMVLLIAAGLFAMTLRNLRGIDAGFDRSNLVLFELNAGEGGRSVQQSVQLLNRLKAGFGTLPAVRSVAFSNFPLLAGEQSGTGVQVDTPRYSAEAWHSVGVNSVSPDFRPTMGIPLLEGRDLQEQDGMNRPGVVLVNESFARRHFPGESAVGRRITFSGSSAFKTENRTAEIVGVIADTHYAQLRQAIEPTVFSPYAQEPLTFGGATFALRTAGEYPGLAELIRAAVRKVDPDLAVGDLRTQEQQVDRLLSRERLFALLSALLGGLALVLTCLGIFGLVAHDVTARAREIGIRMALGAQLHEILALVMRSGVGLAVMGCLIGIAGALGITRVAAQFLYGIEPTDTGVMLAAAMLLLTVTGLASWLPARRAAKVDPVVALRAE